jgi:hypothetical protein
VVWGGFCIGRTFICVREMFSLIVFHGTIVVVTSKAATPDSPTWKPPSESAAANLHEPASREGYAL